MNLNKQDNSWKLKYPIHPGETLSETLEALGMSQKELAERTGLVPKTINEIINGKSSITPESAIKLSIVFGTSVEFWNNLQRNYDENVAVLAEQKKLKNEMGVFSKFTCYKELEKWSYIKKVDTKNLEGKIQNLLEFLGISSLHLISDVYKVAFRKVQHDSKQLNQENLVAWLRAGEIDAKNITTAKFKKEELLKSLDFLRSLTKIEDPKKMQKALVDKCASFGVAIVFVPYFTNTYVCGATRWLNADIALMQLSLRGGTADGFWFTFFHELGHILLHGKKDEFIHYYNNIASEDELKKVKEEEADKFAQDVLIPENEFQNLMSQKPLNEEKVRKFAEKIGIHSGIVAGRVAYEIKDRQNIWPKIEKLRVRYSFEKKEE